MKILRGFKKIPPLDKAKVAIGIFDGVHLGHRKLLGRLIGKARREKRKSVVITFTPHPYRVTMPLKMPPMLVSLEHRLRLLEAEGVDIVCLLDFDRRLANISAAKFVEDALVKRLNMGELFVGDNFRMGREREGDPATLKLLSLKYGFRLTVVKCRKFTGEYISSTLIRRLILRGRLKEASRRLGRDVSLLGTVIKGDRRGRIMGFPTANLDLHHEAAPPSGVYAARVKYGKKRYNGIVNIGFRPTFKKEEKERTVEVHIFGFNKRIYGEDLEVYFVRKIRDERHFRDRHHLKSRIEKDCVAARRMLKILE